MSLLHHPAEIASLTVSCRVLYQGADDPWPKGEAGRLAHHDLDAARFGPGANHRDSLGMTALVHQIERSALHRAHCQAHVHGLCRGGGFVQ
jgi:hypothetical protein